MEALSFWREIYVWFFVLCFLWQRNSHLNRCAPFKPPPSLWVSSSQSLQCPDVIPCMHKLCYCLTGAGLGIAVSGVRYLFLPAGTTGGTLACSYLLDLKQRLRLFASWRRTFAAVAGKSCLRCGAEEGEERRESGSSDSLDCIVWLHDPCCVALIPTLIHSLCLPLFFLLSFLK